MEDRKSDRRDFIKNTALGLSLLSLSSLTTAQSNKKIARRKIVCVGGHPDDPETGCGGTLAKLAKAGHELTVIYLTTGEAGVIGRSHDEAARIRKQEAINACHILDAKPVFAGQIDGDTVVNKDWLKKIQDLITIENPDIVFAHWPIDHHPDHQAASLLTIQAWMHAKNRFLLYFFEVESGLQTAVFHPTDYVDITDTLEQKWKAINCHVSQNPKEIYSSSGHRAMEEFRGMELGVKAAEAFIKMTGRLQGVMTIS
ncbi:MAG: PIG-L deacetylase family protein [Ginsengibacter sp.]